MAEYDSPFSHAADTTDAAVQVVTATADLVFSEAQQQEQTSTARR
ncbi:hypothetical protein [Gordonia rhizosphera]|nr:hypothetical protein [Gordonia rhizosphera]